MNGCAPSLTFIERLNSRQLENGSLAFDEKTESRNESMIILQFVSLIYILLNSIIFFGPKSLLTNRQTKVFAF